MPKPLVIVESPAKARSIGKFLGSGYTVKASRGHVRDLPKSELGVDTENGFDTKWELIKDRSPVLDELRKLLAKTDILYLATDPDREGEAIAWHLVEALTGDHEEAIQVEGLDIKRVVFHEITDAAIKDSFAHPSDIDTDRVDAYKARRILDRLMGYQLSPLLWKKLARGLSAGRVQSVAVSLVVQREREIRAFEPEEYWRILATLGEGDDAFVAHCVEGERRNIKNEEQANEILGRIQGQTFPITKLEQQAKKDRAKPPFITSTLQQAASSAYGFSAKRTMQVAQGLYEGVDLPGEGASGLITYMRTDSFNISKQAQGTALELIENLYGKEYLPEKPNAYRSKKGAQEAHEAIRPTDPRRRPKDLAKILKPEQLKLYELIWRRFMASQMSPARYLVTTVELEPAGVKFSASGRVTEFDGHTRVYGRDRSEEQGLPELAEGQQLDPTDISSTQHFTQPPRRYTEASLVRDLEKYGIGRPSTYASIISTIVDRGYVDRGEEATEEAVRQRLIEEAAGQTADEPEEPAAESEDEDDEESEAPDRPKRTRAFYATRLGEVTTDLLAPYFGDIVNTDFTAAMEDELDLIAEGKLEWSKAIDEFYSKFSKDLAAAEETMSPYWENPITIPEVQCGKVPEDGGEACTAPMVILFNRFGPYLGCSRYPDCKNAKGLSGVKTSSGEMTDHKCRKKNDKGVVCGRAMEKKVNRWGSAFLACTGFKDKLCDGTVSLSKAGEPLWPVETDIPCPDCETPLVVKRSRRGKFLACTRYPKCRGTMSLPACTHQSRTGKACGKPMTEPAGGGKMKCKTHPTVKLKPKLPKSKTKDKGEEGDAAPKKAKAKAKKKTGTKKPAS